ncbi:MAG: PTS sugar transporter subunit IIA [Planktomarina sp.]
MFGIVIVAHGRLAVEYLAAVEHVVGKQAGISVVAIHADHNRADKTSEISAAADAVDTGSGVVLVTDMFGGSPSNLALPACRGQNRRVIYGANLPMLVKLAKCRKRPMSEAITEAIAAGRKYLDCLPVET